MEESTWLTHGQPALRSNQLHSHMAGAQSQGLYDVISSEC